MRKEDKAGLYITVIVHLAVIILLLLTSIGYSLQRENSFVIDFSKAEQKQRKEAVERRLQEDEEFSDAIAQRISQMLQGSAGVEFRNTATNRAALKDDRGTDANKLYADAQRLAQDLKNGFSVDESNDDYVETPQKEKSSKNEQKEYSGPSVVSYDLGGRKASKLPIPAYRCYGAGMVTVLIVVDPAGNVVNAKVQEETSSDDNCLRNFAVRAARSSKFAIDRKAPPRQGGNIVYQFIAQ